MPNELKPCPFCGNSAYSHKKYCPYSKKNRYVVKCSRCNAVLEYRDKESAIEAWNRRADNER